MMLFDESWICRLTSSVRTSTKTGSSATFRWNIVGRSILRINNRSGIQCTSYPSSLMQLAESCFERKSFSLFCMKTRLALMEVATRIRIPMSRSDIYRQKYAWVTRVSSSYLDDRSVQDRFWVSIVEISFFRRSHFGWGAEIEFNEDNPACSLGNQTVPQSWNGSSTRTSSWCGSNPRGTWAPSEVSNCVCLHCSTHGFLFSLGKLNMLENTRIGVHWSFNRRGVVTVLGLRSS